MKRAVTALLVMILAMLGLAGCMTTESGRLPVYEWGYYRYAADEKHGWAYIVGLTEEGKEQTELIIPEKIGEYRVSGIGYSYSLPLFGYENVGEFYSEKAEKIYFPFEYKGSVWSYVQGSNPNAYTVKWYISDCEPYLIGGAGAIYGYRLYEAKHRSNIRSDHCRVANVTYLYNYVGCPNGGEYWVDSYDASPISFIPPEPEREEYRFCGWYKEPECINAWDFEKDVTGEELVISRDNQYTEYEGIYLYAKWER